MITLDTIDPRCPTIDIHRAENNRHTPHMALCVKMRNGTTETLQWLSAVDAKQFAYVLLNEALAFEQEGLEIAA